MKPSHKFHLIYYASTSESNEPIIVITGGNDSCESAVIREFDFRNEVAQEEMTSFYKTVVGYCNEHNRNIHDILNIIYYTDINGKIVGLELFDNGNVMDLLPIVMNTMTAFYR